MGSTDEDEPLALEPRAMFDPAIVGIGRRFNSTFLVYDQVKVLEILAADMEDSEDPELDALEHFEYNIVGGWVGDGTPAFITPLEQAA